jgi:Surface antigen variable number repeat/Omp85 superfamily domain
MPGFRSIPIALYLWTISLAVYAQDPSAPASQPPVAPVRTVRTIVIIGTKELSEETVRRAVPVELGVPTAETLERIGEAVAQRYRDEGYTFAQVTPVFDEATGTLSLAVDEGVIDSVEFHGVEDFNVVRTFLDEFALRAGDVFNRKRAMRALEVLLRPTRGAIQPGGLPFSDSRGSRRGTFDLIHRSGQRVLLVSLNEPAGRFRVVPDLGDREDWFTPVDGVVPSLGFGATVFDHHEFNHAYVLGHVSVKTASQRGGYALGFERPVFRTNKLFLGGELHDLTATDDRWQVSPTEASLAAIGPRKSFRDYYRRRGVQINAALRIHPRAELLFAWRGERQENLMVETDFSLWNGDEPFRPNRTVVDGRLSAILVGGSVNAESFDRESLDASYRRHQLENPFGDRLNEPDRRHDAAAVWRIDWTSEVSTPGALRSDFDFRRHLVSARGRLPVSPHQEVAARLIAGWSGGTLPPQRQFAIGGIGSVHGYEFKEAVGDTLMLLNLEYALGWRRIFQVLGFFDTGRVTLLDPVRPVDAQAPAAVWLNGVGFGIAAGGVRLDFGYKLDAVPSSLQVLLRFGRTF